MIRHFNQCLISNCFVTLWQWHITNVQGWSTGLTQCQSFAISRESNDIKWGTQHLTTFYSTVWRNICSCTHSRFKYWYCADRVTTAGWEFHSTEVSSTSKRWTLGETNIFTRNWSWWLFTNDRTIRVLCRLCPRSVWKHLPLPYTLWQKQHISAGYVYDTFYKILYHLSDLKCYCIKSWCGL